MSVGVSGSAVPAALEVVTSEFDYEQLEEIGSGEGRNSRVFRAFDPQQGGEIAVKEIKKADFPDPTEYFREAQAMRRADCPNVVPIRAASTAGDRICLVMPLLRNGSLQKRINGGPLPLREAIRVGQGMLKGISQIHVANIIHFDIKPTNVLFSDTDEPLVADFGQSRIASATGATPIPGLYIPAMPPETIVHRHGDRPSDIFQAGLTMYRALNGEPEYHSQLTSASRNIGDAITRGKFPNRDGYLPHVPKWLRVAVNRAMMVDPSKRYASANDFAAALGRHPVRLDWRTTYTDSSSIEWCAPRHNAPEIVVKFEQRGSQHAVEVYTKSSTGVLRRKDQSVSWRNGLSKAESLAYLKDLFRSLEQV